MPQSLITVTAAEDSKPLEAAIDVLNANTDMRKSFVDALILFG